MTGQPEVSFAELLRQLRAEARLTQEELAEAAGVSPRSVSDLERGVTRTAHKDTAVLLAGALGLAGPTGELFVAAARGRAPAGGVLAVVQGEKRGESLAEGTVAGGVHGFAPALTSFVGRGKAAREVAGLLERYRLVTVTGPGGVGKTRLAGEVAGRMAALFADGVWLAELAPLADPALVPSVVAAALGVQGLPGVAATEALARVLARRQMLLVLDNCEHVIGAAAELCSGLLSACDDVRVLATSRGPLAMAGEARYRLAPLGMSDPDGPGAAGSEAVTLFADRARQVDMHFVLDAETGPAVARLVARLDGMPLAIELAAARVEALGVAQLLDRLNDRFELLTAGDRLAAERQRSLAATVAWSYELLDEPERRVFRSVSVFPGPFTLEAAGAVAGDGADLAVLRLVDCSLLSPPQAGPDGRSRYVMLETVRAYSAGLLAQAGGQNAAAAAQARYALQVAEQAAAGLQTSTGESAAARWLDAEDATMRKVLAWALEQDVAIALRLAVALAPWWLLRGRAAEECPLLRQAAGRVGTGGDAWCAAHFWLGQAALHAGDQAGALGHFTAVRDAIGDQGPSRALADCLGGRSVTLANLGRVAEAAEDGRCSLALARELGYPAGEALALADLSIAARCAGDLRTALQLARQAEQIPADIPGWIARLCGHILTDMLIEAGDLAAAKRSCAAGLARSRNAGDLRNYARMLRQMAVLDLKAGRMDDARAHLRESLETAVRTGGGIHVLYGLNCCGYLCAATGRRADAVTAWAAMAASPWPEGLTEAPADARRRQEALREARQALGPARAQAAEDRGAAMSLATAAEYALMLTAPAPPPPGAGILSGRERALVTLVAQGRTDAEIAAELCISIRAVSAHLDRIRDKTGCRRRADLTRLALRGALV